ncbi:MAG: BrnT family toxin [Cyanobacteria bacterium J06573_11]
MHERIRFVWDELKARSNLKKHGISFDEAKSAFYDPSARVVFDPDHSQEEDRYILLGLSQSLRMLAICHVHIEDDSTIRLISARKATKTERKQYKEFNP